jgi:hypothetical protein
MARKNAAGPAAMTPADILSAVGAAGLPGARAASQVAADHPAAVNSAAASTPRTARSSGVRTSPPATVDLSLATRAGVASK